MRQSLCYNVKLRCSKNCDNATIPMLDSIVLKSDKEDHLYVTASNSIVLNIATISILQRQIQLFSDINYCFYFATSNFIHRIIATLSTCFMLQLICSQRKKPLNNSMNARSQLLSLCKLKNNNRAVNNTGHKRTVHVFLVVNISLYFTKLAFN